jgi:hypothetical protein
MTTELLVERLYSLDELLELRRNVLRYARTFLRETSAISTCRSPSPFARCSKVRNGVGLTRSKAQCCPLIDPVGTKADPSHDTYRGRSEPDFEEPSNRWPTYPNLQLLPMNAGRDIGAPL